MLSVCCPATGFFIDHLGSLTGNRHFSYWISLQILFEYIYSFEMMLDADIIAVIGNLWINKLIMEQQQKYPGHSLN